MININVAPFFFLTNFDFFYIKLSYFPMKLKLLISIKKYCYIIKTQYIELY